MSIREGGRKKRREKPQETLHREQTEGLWKKVVGGWSIWVMGIKEGACCDECWVL